VNYNGPQPGDQMSFWQWLKSINGISLPWFGVSWNLPRKREALDHLLLELSDRRLLFDPHCGTAKLEIISSVQSIRSELTATMRVFDIKGRSYLMRGRRAAQLYQTWVEDRAENDWQARGDVELRKADQFRIRIAQELEPLVRLYGVAVPPELQESFDRAFK